MKRLLLKHKAFLCLVSSLFLLCGCIITPTQSRHIQQDIYDIKVQVNRLQTLQGDTYKLMQSRIDEMQEKEKARYDALLLNQAQQEKRIEELREELRQLRIRLEEDGFRPGTSEGKDGQPSSSLGSRQDMEIAITEDGETLVGDNLLSSGRLSFSRGEYPEARKVLEEYLKYFPRSPNAEEALFLIGDSYYYQKQYDQAMEYFMRITREHPAGKKVPDALMKSALCAQKQGRFDDARASLRKLQKDFPGYKEMVRVRAMLREMEAQ